MTNPFGDLAPSDSRRGIGMAGAGPVSGLTCAGSSRREIPSETVHPVEEAVCRTVGAKDASPCTCEAV